jgi:hypothetical protein
MAPYRRGTQAADPHAAGYAKEEVAAEAFDSVREPQHCQEIGTFGIQGLLEAQARGMVSRGPGSNGDTPGSTVRGRGRVGPAGAIRGHDLPCERRMV